MNTDKYKSWQHFPIDNALPGSAWGTGGIGVADFNGDGKVDVAISRREPQTAYWYEQKGTGTWVPHIINSSECLNNTLGAAALDMDQDGWVDLAFNNVWFKNPGCLATNPDKLWEAHSYSGGGHDVIAADINSDGKLDLVTYDGHILTWFDTSNQLAKTVVCNDRDDHGGVAPNGVGDLNGNGFPDIVLPGMWYENPGNGYGKWKQHAWPYEPIPNASYGVSIRAWVIDLNGDGWNDIVYSDCDTGFSHVYWVENLGGGREWLRHNLPDPPGDPRTGSFHSLGVADLDNDGYLEIFAGEQEDPDTYMVQKGLLPMKPEGLLERGVIWVQSNATPLTFTPVVIHQGRPGWHDAVLADIDGDGKVDIVSKVWNADGPNYHLDLWQNHIEGS